MKNSLLALFTAFFAFLFGQNLLLGQDAAREFGKISKFEIDLTEAPDDPDAAAVVLFDIGKSVFVEIGEQFFIKFKRHTRIKVFKKSAASFGDISIPYYISNSHREESVHEIKACSYNYSGGKMEISLLSDKDIFREKTTQQWNQVKFAVPKVSENTIFEYEYEILTPFVFNFRNWEFQSELPSLYSQYSASLIPFYEYVVMKQGNLELDVDTSYVEPGTSNYFSGIKYNDKTFLYAISNVPAFYEEKYMTTKEDYIAKVDFQLSKINHPNAYSENVMSTWDNLTRDLLADERFGKLAKPNSTAKTVISELALSGLNDTEKLDKISRYVKENYKWNGINGVYARQIKKDFHEKRSGNVAEINLFLTSLLSSAGFDAYPVLLSTRDHGKIKMNYPFLDYFNYVVVGVKLNDNVIILDATERYLPYNVVPPRCLNDYAISIKKRTDARFLKLNDNANSYKNTVIMLNFNPETSRFDGNCLIKVNGYEALELRRDWHVYGKEEISKNLQKELGNVEFSDLEISNTDDFDKSLDMSFKVSFPVSTMNNLIFFKPLFSYVATENPFKLEKRNYPVDFGYRQSTTYRVSLVVPSNFSVEELPESILEQSSDKTAQFQFMAQQTGQVIQILSIENFTKSEYDSSQYEELKSLYNKVYIKQNEPVTLKRN